MTEDPTGTNSKTDAKSRLRHLAEIIAIPCGLACFFPAISPKIWALLMNDAVAIIAPLAVFSTFAGTIFSSVARWRELPPEMVRGLSSSLGARIGIIILMVGGGVSVIAATLNQLGIRLPFATIPGPGFTIATLVLAALPVVFVASVASLLVANLRVPRAAIVPQPSQSSAPPEIKRSHQTMLFRYAIIFSILCFLSPFAIPLFKRDNLVAKESKDAKEISKPEPKEPPFQYEEPYGFDHAPPSRWKVIAEKIISDLDDTQPVSLAPDGRHLAYYPYDRGFSGIRVIDLNRFVPVASHMDHIVTPVAWSPDSMRLFFVAGSSEQVGWVLRLDTGKSIRLPIPAGKQLPVSQPFWWSNDEIAFFPDGEEAAWLNLDSLQIYPIKESPTWKERVRAGEANPPPVKAKPPATSRCSLAIGTQITAFESPRFRQKEWETGRLSSFFIKDRLHSHFKILPGLPYSPGDRVLTAKSGSKMVFLAGSIAKIYYLGLDPGGEPVWSVEEMPGKPDSFSKSGSAASKYLEDQTLCVFVSAPVVNPLNGRVVGPNRKHVKALARVLSWDGQAAAIWISEQYLPINEGDIVSDLHVWKDEKPAYLKEFSPEHWWTTISHPSEEEAKLTISSEAGSIDRTFLTEFSQDEDGLFVIGSPPTDPVPKKLTADEIVTAPIRNDHIVPPLFQTDRTLVQKSADEEEKKELRKQIADLKDEKDILQQTIADLRVPRGERVTEDDIRRFVTVHHQKATRKDLNGFVSDYGDQIDYYDKGIVDRNFIRKDQGDYFARYVELVESVDGFVEVNESGHHLYEVTYPLALGIIRTDGKQQIKLVRVTMEVNISTGFPKIVSEDSKVIKSSGRPK